MNNTHNYVKKVFGAGNIGKIEELRVKFVRKFKIIVFCPESHTEKIAKAMSKAGAGVIGKYLDCSFRLKGKGTFRGGAGTNPYIGRKGELKSIDEIRLEMICNSEDLEAAIKSMLNVHPYDEPAYDIYEVLSGIRQKNAYAVKVTLKKPQKFLNVLNKLNIRIDNKLIPAAWKRVLAKQAVVDFSGDEVIQNIMKSEKGSTLYITKNLKKSINIRLI